MLLTPDELRAVARVFNDRDDVAERLCGDWPAPCNCDNPDTHDGH